RAGQCPSLEAVHARTAPDLAVLGHGVEVRQAELGHVLALPRDADLFYGGDRLVDISGLACLIQVAGHLSGLSARGTDLDVGKELVAGRCVGDQNGRDELERLSRVFETLQAAPPAHVPGAKLGRLIKSSLATRDVLLQLLVA